MITSSTAAAAAAATSSHQQPLIFFLLISLLAGPTLARNRHVITISNPGLHPGSLAWDPSAQHFLVGSRIRPAVSSVSDAGVIEALVSDPLLPPDSQVSAVAVDDARRRLLVALARPAALAAYDLRSPRPHSRIFAFPLPDAAAVPGGVAVDPATGNAYVTSATAGQIWKVDPQGRASVFSESPIYAGGLDGVAHVRRGFLLAVQGSTGRVFKVDDEDAAARLVLSGRDLAPGAEAVAVTSDGSAVVAGGRAARVLRSLDGWAEAGVYDGIPIDEGLLARGVAVREGRRAYVLVVPQEEKGGGGEEEEEVGGVNNDGSEGYNGKRSSGRIEEVEWGREERDGEMVWGFVLLGLGLTYFLYWRFQMGQLVTSINKKRA